MISLDVLLDRLRSARLPRAILKQPLHVEKLIPAALAVNGRIRLFVNLVGAILLERLDHRLARLIGQWILIIDIVFQRLHGESARPLSTTLPETTL